MRRIVMVLATLLALMCGGFVTAPAQAAPVQEAAAVPADFSFTVPAAQVPSLQTASLV